MTRVILSPEARAEALEVFRWYEQEREGLGKEFRAELKQAIERIRALPLAYRVAYKDLRVALVDRFPYAMFYRALPDGSIVVAVVHQKRHPRTWKRRA